MPAFTVVNPTLTATTINCRSGAVYQTDQNGAVTVQLVDLLDLLSNGFEIASNPQFSMGNSGQLFRGMGNMAMQVSNPGIQPGGTGVDSVLAVATIKANAFDVAGRGLMISAQGSFGATVNTKRVKLIFAPTAAVVGSAVTGGTVIADTAAVTTNGGGWSLMAEVYKYGAAGSNTQLALHQQAQIGAAVAALLAPVALTAAENSAILVALTGNATTAVSDIAGNTLQITAMN